MNVWMMLLQFVILMTVITGVTIFFLHRSLISSTDGAVKRLNTETEAVRAKQTELNQKIKEANEELEKRKKEADDLMKKMRDEADEVAKVEREKIVKKAREDGEEIIAKAQRTKDQIRKEVQKELEIKTVDFAVAILQSALSEKARAALDTYLIEEFLANLEKMNMAEVSVEADSADVVTISAIDDAIKSKFAKIIKEKMNRDIKINATVDPAIAGGAILRFGSLAVDGSLQSMIREIGVTLKKKAEGE